MDEEDDEFQLEEEEEGKPGPLRYFRRAQMGLHTGRACAVLGKTAFQLACPSMQVYARSLAAGAQMHATDSLHAA